MMNTVSSHASIALNSNVPVKACRFAEEMNSAARKWFCVIILICSCTILSVAQEPVYKVKFESLPFDALVKKAAQENKMIFIDCYTSWCGPCKQMDREVFTNQEVGDYYNKHFISTRVDMEKGEGPVLDKFFKVQAYPTLIFLDKTGQVAFRKEGIMYADEFLPWGHRLVEKYPLLDNYKKRFEGGERQNEFLTSYIELLQRFEKDAKIPALEFLKQNGENKLLASFPASLIMDYVDKWDASEFQYFLKERDAFEKELGVKAVKDKIWQVMKVALFDLIESEDFNEDKLKQLKDQFTGYKFDGISAIFLHADVSYFFKKEDYRRCSETILKLSEETRLTTRELNDFAWKLCEKSNDLTVLQNARLIARKSLELEDRSYNNGTYAAVLAKLGERESAIVFQLRSIDLAERAGVTDLSEYYKKLEAIKKGN
jgi:thioredoxin-related protein